MAEVGDSMPRRYRSILPGHPHHVIQRGNRRQQVFFSDDDRRFYLKHLRLNCDKYSVSILAYCLMINHVHLVLILSTWESLALVVGETHKNYTRMINKREKWRGYLWQERFLSFILDEVYFWSVMRYVELNPVRAGLVPLAQDYFWSSARGHVGLSDDPVIDKVTLLPHWADILKCDIGTAELLLIRSSCSSGRPLGGQDFINFLYREHGIDWQNNKRGPKGV